MERKSCALIGGSRAADLLKKGEKSTACLRFKMALAVQLAQLIDAGICHFFSCMHRGRSSGRRPWCWNLPAAGRISASR